MSKGGGRGMGWGQERKALGVSRYYLQELPVCANRLKHKKTELHLLMA